ncbi:hypothetical protein Rhopal_001050-T1 [Rhodotorula paludigena]|uniref:Carbonic anhydrase n=1 Tax=Rhodotorula paludigena TaxID=86838 RepID=A0AAV5GDX9_9BASI|nr:hypothetical protein Rhopal_001050-T1 [Rhodotorula paludigena]
MTSHLTSLASTAYAKAANQPDLKGPSFADAELAVNNSNFIKTYDVLVGDKGRAHLMPKRGIAVICCMDARLDPNAMLGLEVGDAHIIRNGGGRAADALRSLIGSQEALQTREIIVIHHEDCGFSHASTTVVQKALKARTPLSAHPFVDAVSLQEFSDPRESVQEDVAFLREHPLVHPDSKISGWVYRVSNGELLRAC